MRFFLNCWRTICIFEKFSLLYFMIMKRIDGKYGVEFLKEKENRLDKEKNKSFGNDDFALAIARIAVAQVCKSLGYQSFQQSALDALLDVGVRYVREIGKTAISCANLANRNECNVFDVIQGLEYLGSVQGFSGASDYNHCLSGSGVVRDIIRYVDEAEIFPFAYSIPIFPVMKERNLYASFAQMGKNPPVEYIPSWLPKFPDPETYVDLNSSDKKEVELAVESKTEERHMKVERSLLNLQQKLICNGLETLLADEHGYAAKAQRTVESNPFLAPPLQFEEKEVSLPVIPAKLSDEATKKCQKHAVLENHVSVLDPYAPATEDIGAHSFKSLEDRRKVPLNGRDTVKFKFGSSRKCSGTAMSPWNEGVGEVSIWFGVDHDGKHDKKRRAELIIGENMENLQNITGIAKDEFFQLSRVLELLLLLAVNHSAIERDPEVLEFTMKRIYAQLRRLG